MAIVLHHSRAKGTAKLVLVGIANHDGDGGAWPSMATLARYAGVDARNARKAVAKLVALREVRVYVQEGGTLDWDDNRRPNRYELLLACPPACDRTKHHRMPGDSTTPPLWTTPTNLGITGGTEAPPRTEAPGGAPGASAPQTSPLITPPPGSASTTGHARRTTHGITPPCVECSAPDLETCLARQAKVAQADRHSYTPRPLRPRREDPTP
jgi:hypothetical protein